MIKETFDGYMLSARPVRKGLEKFAVSVEISRENMHGEMLKKRFFAADGICYILEIEAAKESINLGRNLIKRNMVGF